MKASAAIKKIPASISAWFTFFVLFAQIANTIPLTDIGLIGDLLYLGLVLLAPVVMVILIIWKNPENQFFYKKWWFWLICSLAALVLISSADEPSEPDAPTAPTVQAISTTTPSKPHETNPAKAPTAPSPEPTTVPPTTVPEITVYKDGMYKVGVDIDPGEYFIVCSKSSCYFQVSSDSSGSLNSIIANDNISAFTFITVDSGQYLMVEGGEFVKAKDAAVPGANSNGIYGEGMYRVGIDIPAGEYKITCAEGRSCYVQVSRDSYGTLSSIIVNDNISATHYITVSEGQYLTVECGAFILVN